MTNERAVAPKSILKSGVSTDSAFLHFVAAWEALNCRFMMEAISWKSGRISSCIVKCSYGAVIWMLPTGQFIVRV